MVTTSSIGNGVDRDGSISRRSARGRAALHDELLLR